MPETGRNSTDHSLHLSMTISQLRIDVKICNYGIAYEDSEYVLTFSVISVNEIMKRQRKMSVTPFSITGGGGGWCYGPFF